MTTDVCVVFVTVGKPDEADKIANAVVEERLAACCTLIPAVRSIYRWKGDICKETETLMVLKTSRDHFERLRARIIAMHSYEVPEIISLPVLEGHEPYLNWVRDETKT